MIILEKGERLHNEPNLEVYIGGEYNETDLVLVNQIGDDTPKYQYLAIYIKTGQFEYE
jgi:hypothetical protein